MDAGRRRETTGLETKDSLLFTAITVTRVLAFVLVPQAAVPIGNAEGQVTPEHVVGCIQERNPEVKETKFL